MYLKGKKGGKQRKREKKERERGISFYGSLRRAYKTWGWNKPGAHNAFYVYLAGWQGSAGLVCHLLPPSVWMSRNLK